MLKLHGGKPKFAEIRGGEIFHEGPKQKNLQITRMKLKKKKITEEKTENDIYYKE